MPSEKASQTSGSKRLLAVYDPPHYKKHPSGVECIEIAEWLSFNLGNVIKYVWRAGLKNPDPMEDLEKAKWYIEREIWRLQREQK